MKVRITAFAKARLDKIDDYYTGEGYPKYGIKLRQEIVKKSKLLSINPQMGQVETYLSKLNKGHRYIVVESKYKVIYLVNENVIYITDIFDTRQNPNKITEQVI